MEITLVYIMYHLEWEEEFLICPGRFNVNYFLKFSLHVRITQAYYPFVYVSDIILYSLTTVAQSKPYREKPFNQGLLQPQGALYPIQTIIPSHLEFRTSFHQTISSAFLVQGNFKHTQFSQEHWTWRDSNLQPHAPKARAILIELIPLFGGFLFFFPKTIITNLELGVAFFFFLFIYLFIYYR